MRAGTEVALLSAVASVFCLGACTGFESEYEKGVYDYEPLYCYQTIGATYSLISPMKIRSWESVSPLMEEAGQHGANSQLPSSAEVSRLYRPRCPHERACRRHGRRDRASARRLAASALRTDRHCFRRLVPLDPLVVELREFNGRPHRPFGRRAHDKTAGTRLPGPKKIPRAAGAALSVLSARRWGRTHYTKTDVVGPVVREVPLADAERATARIDVPRPATHHTDGALAALALEP